MFKYQVIKLTKTTPNGLVLFSAPNIWPIAQYNNIHSFRFYVSVSPGLTGSQSAKVVSAINIMEINTFKISEYEIVGPNTPIKLFARGNSIPASERYTEINIPNNNKPLDILISQTVFGGSSDANYTGDIYLILRLNNIDEKEHLKGYYRYETWKHSITGPEKPTAVKYKTKAGAKRLVGLFSTFMNPTFQFVDGVVPANRNTYQRIGGISNSSIGRLALLLNNKRSQPVLLNLRDYTYTEVDRAVKPLELDEPIIQGTEITGYFRQDPNSGVTAGNFFLYLTFKFSL